MTGTWDPAPVLDRLVRLRGRRGLWRTYETIDPAGVLGHADLDGTPVDRLEGSGDVSPALAAALTMRAVLTVLHDRRLDLPFDHNVHASQALAWHAPVTLGASIETRAWIGRVKSTTRAVFFDVETESRTRDGQLWLSGTSTHALRHE
ncbi:hypothetical protein QQG74_20165 [Micromonospora sp. FIMYZ51]|uniref:hypothetical protein n=1 Tax=Micromonospora sp. FIMYZ51 TaxID=3051832 RepID=UPI0031201F45